MRTSACPADSRETHAFTMVELLCVMAIICLLVAILMPLFNRSPESARSTYCRSNMQQIGISLRLYAQDFDGLFPVAEHSVNDALLSYTHNYHIFLCPKDPRPWHTLQRNLESGGDTPGTWGSYLYYPGLALDAAPQSRLLSDADFVHLGRANVTFLNQSTESVSPAQWTSRGWDLPAPPWAADPKGGH